MHLEEINFDDITPHSETVRIMGVSYTLKEATADAVAKFQNLITSGSKIENGKVVGFGNTADAGPVLISNCLFNPEGQNVPVPIIRQWPNRITEPLLKRIRLVSGLSDEEPLEKRIENLRKQLAEAEAELAEKVKEGNS